MSKAHTIIIDDNPHNVKVLVQLLSVEDVTCTELSQVQNLFADLDKLPSADVIFLDLEFPKTNGYDLLAIIKQHPRFRSIPVIAYTVHVSEMDTVSHQGFDGFLGKPLNAELFPQQLQQILEGKRVWYNP